MSAAAIRRALGLWMVLATVVVAWYVAGAVVCLTALLVGSMLVWAAGRLGGWTVHYHAARAHQLGLLTVPAAGLWLMATVAMIAAPSTRSPGSPHFFDGLGGIAAASGRVAIGQSWGSVVDVIVVGALVSSLFVARALRRPRPLAGQSLDVARSRVRAILADHAEDSLAPYVLRPDKRFEIVEDGLVAFTVIADTVVISADPVGSPEGASRALAQLTERARRAGLGICAFGASERFLEDYRSLGLSALCAGEEAVVDPRGFSLEGRTVRKLRQSVNRVARRGWSVSLHEGREIDGRLEAEIAGVEATWRAGRRAILGFAMSMGAHDTAIGPDDLYVLARSPEGQLGGVMRFIAHRDKLSLDVMRRVGETPNGLNEALVCAALARAGEMGVCEVSLNYAGLGHLLRAGADRRRLRALAATPALARLRAHFQLDRLIDFNQKFAPAWRPRYLVYESRAALPRTLWRVLQAEGHLPHRGARGQRPLLDAGLSRPATARDATSR